MQAFIVSTSVRLYIQKKFEKKKKMYIVRCTHSSVYCMAIPA